MIFKPGPCRPYRGPIRLGLYLYLVYVNKKGWIQDFGNGAYSKLAGHAPVVRDLN